MPVIQISQIKHRIGLEQDLPQLASAELGWAVDTRKLFIGNGTLAQGAPTEGNTEILTEYSDLLSVATAYTYKGEAGGYTVQTGPSALSPVARSLQSKLDDFVNVRDFGAIGDGVTDDTAAINRAIVQLYNSSTIKTNLAVRRVLYFPAGTYRLTSGIISIPPYATLIGDGQDSTLISQETAAQTCVATTVDSLYQTGASIGSNSAQAPDHIFIRDMTFKTTISSDVVIVESATNVHFDNVGFKGSIAQGSNTSAGAGKAGVKTLSSAVATSKVTINRCTFSDITYGISSGDGTDGVVVSASVFSNVYQGVYVYTNSQEFRIVQNYFSLVADAAINVGANCPGCLSSLNIFENCGSSFTADVTPSSSIIVFGNVKSYSIGDFFDRVDAGATTYPRVNYTGTSSTTDLTQAGAHFGRLKMGIGHQLTLTDNTSSATSTGVTIPSNTVGAVIVYTVTRNGSFRSGLFKLAQATAANVYDDEYHETTATGVTLSTSTSGGVTTLYYTTSSTGNDATLKIASITLT